MFTPISFANNLDHCGPVTGKPVGDLHLFPHPLHLSRPLLFLHREGIVLLERLLEVWLLVRHYCLLLLRLDLHGGVEENHKNISLMYLLRRIQKSIWGSLKGFHCENYTSRRILLAIKIFWEEVDLVRCTKEG